MRKSDKFGFVMPARKSFSRNHHRQALDMLGKGYSYEEVGDEFGVAADTIYRLKKKHSFQGKTVVAKGRKVTVRLSEVELKSLQAFREQNGKKSNSDAVRAMIRSSQGFLELSAEAQAEFEELKRKIEGMANNINQVAYAANAKRIVLVREQWEDVEELRKGLGELSRTVKDVMREMRRKSVKLWQKSGFDNG